MASRTLARSLVGTMSALLLASAASAQGRGAAGEQRVALVVGNSTYAVAPLRNPVNDADDMAQMLRTLGFRVTLRTNATQRQMVEAINALGQELKKGGVGLFYFAGHGVQSKGRNFLIPVDADIKGEAQLEFDSVDANRVLAAMDDAGNPINLLILDACRDNPFGRSFRSAARGLAQMEAAQGAYIAFATAPGSVALDGQGRNGLYTQHLLQSLKQPDTDIDKVFRRVTAEVARATGGKQVPWVSSSLTGDFSFRREKPAAADPSANDRAFWEQVKDSRNPDELKAYLEQFPGGSFVALARVRLKALAGEQSPAQVAKTAPAAPTPAREVAPSDTQPRLGSVSLPFVNDGARARIEREILAGGKEQKALALTEAGGWGGATGRASVEDARAGALENCQTRNPRHPCFLAMVNGQFVLEATYTPQTITDGAIALLKRASLQAEFYSNEERDEGVRPASVRHAGRMHAATPRSVPGATTITTRQLVELYRTSRPVLINALDWTEGAFALPGTTWIQGMGKAKWSGSEWSALKATVGQVAPDKSAPLVVYCLSWECWLSYNATISALELGYKNVYWYRGGLSAWNQARLPVVRTRLLKQF